MQFRVWLFLLTMLFFLISLYGVSNNYSIHPPSITPYLTEQLLLLDITHAGDRLITVGEHGHILISDDHAEHWRHIQTPTQTTLTSVFFIDDLTGWVTGHDALILKTIDGGESWKIIYSATEKELPLFDIWFQNSTHGYAVGAYGYVLETLDGGINWEQKRISGDDFHLNQIRAAGQECLFIAGESGSLYQSTNSGDNWQSTTTPYQGSFYSVLPLDCHHIWLAGLRGHLFYSEDAGKSWQQHKVPTEAMLTDLILSKEQQLIVSGLDGTLFMQVAGKFMPYLSKYKYDFISIIEYTEDGFILTSDRGLVKINKKDFTLK